MIKERYPLDGKEIPGKTVQNPYREIRLHDMEQMNFASREGKVAEINIMAIWSGKMPSKQSEITNPGRKILEMARPFFAHKTMTPEIMNNFINFLLTTENEKLLTNLLSGLDGNLNTSFTGELSLTKEYLKEDENDRRLFYLINTALTITREVIKPTFVFRNKKGHLPKRYSSALDMPGRLIPDARVNGTGQIDGLVISDSYIPDCDFNLFSYLETGLPWQIWETKLPFRLRFVSGKQKIKKIFSWDDAQIWNRMGNFLLSWDKKHNEKLTIEDPEYKAFNWPTNVNIIYLRGVLPPVVHIMPINMELITAWQQRVEAAIDDPKWDNPNDWDLEQLLLLNPILQGEIELRQKNRKSDKKQRPTKFDPTGFKQGSFLS